LALSPSTMMCTEMWCFPPENSTQIIEVPCNSCGITKPVFVTGFFNIYKSCSGREILVFLGQEHIETKYGDFSRCRYKIGFFLTYN